MSQQYTSRVDLASTLQPVSIGQLAIFQPSAGRESYNSSRTTGPLAISRRLVVETKKVRQNAYLALNDSNSQSVAKSPIRFPYHLTSEAYNDPQPLDLTRPDSR